MNLRTAWLALVQHHALDRPTALQLESLAPWHEPPPQLQRHLWRTVAVLAAALGGLGIVMWIASNWDTLGRPARFALLQGFVAVMYAGALWRAAARVPLGILALLVVMLSLASSPLRIVAMAVSGAAAVVAWALPLKLNIVVAIGVAVGLSLLLDRKREGAHHG